VSLRLDLRYRGHHWRHHKPGGRKKLLRNKKHHAADEPGQHGGNGKKQVQVDLPLWRPEAAMSVNTFDCGPFPQCAAESGVSWFDPPRYVVLGETEFVTLVEDGA
jgi:hypothetical protein